jgi:DNA-binding HxlR family transcriptional regulator
MEVFCMLTKEEVLPQCPVATTVSLIGNKWKLLIIRNLLNGKARFGDLKDGIDGISKKVLTDNLKSMVDDGIIIRTAYNEIPPRVEYELSDLGNSLRPIIDSMKIWGEEYKKMKS